MMERTMLHVFRNCPLGRENLLQSAYFCEKQAVLSLSVYVPATTQFSMTLNQTLVHVQLDASYVAFPETAREHVKEVVRGFNCRLRFQNPPEYYHGLIPPLPADCAIMACPRVISEQSSRIGLGHIGPKVRALVKEAPFPVLIPSMAFKPWRSVTAFFGGSKLGAMAVKHALVIARNAGMPLNIYTQLTDIDQKTCETELADMGLLEAIQSQDVHWRTFTSGSFEENLYEVAADSLVVVGAAGHRLIKELVFGSKLEAVQSALPNPLVVIGPKCELGDNTIWN